MKHMIDEARLLIFDLDGTLYEDTDHFDYYCKLLQQCVEEDKKKAFWHTYESMKKGTHPVAIGKVYDIKNDTSVTVDPMTLQVTKVTSFEGEEWPEERIKQEYAGELVYDFDRLIAIGDGWWLPYATAMHFGLKQSDTWECYNATKEYMVTEQFQLTKTPGLKDGLARLKEEKKLVLLTNSEREDVKRLLRELELEGIFHALFTEGQKPLKTKEKIQTILDEFDVQPHEAVSIGDNFINEIAPSLLLGLKAIYIQPNRIEVEHENLIVIPTLTNAL
ncbi:HAD family hydrolase [Fictibacillus phosphorivorans]|uniref:HAD family hydrolase n=1 Tax=Fictibacillus phosphorivorans TaxID=1221500 RepID=UPI00203BF10C|nr:HAD family hydrolase [Fictibacillus phosphorivorans]MCM3717435.1 HAD hydrolase-like protein [Fictibacillus phosphorivorans]MCM3775130.1 HAD hydrolase-like protein [Fictibacillus phosphorivorans]